MIVMGSGSAHSSGVVWVSATETQHLPVLFEIKYIQCSELGPDWEGGTCRVSSKRFSFQPDERKAALGRRRKTQPCGVKRTEPS